MKKTGIMGTKMKFIGAVSMVALVALCAVQAQAKSPGGLLGGGGEKGKNKEPIEVTSDTLEVFQQENRAVFSGHVVAIQGDTRLKADSMNIFYNPPKDQGAAGDKKADKQKKPEAPADNAADNKDAKAGGASDSVKKIDVQGNVFLSTPEETASGDNGTYDVEHNMIFLNNNVVLTRGQNVLKGNHLTYNFATGKSVLTSEAGDKATGSGEAASGGKQRVRALFVPENGQNPAKANQGVTKEKK